MRGIDLLETDQRLSSILSIAVHSERNGSRATQSAPETRNPKEHRRYNPSVVFARRPPKTHKSYSRRQKHRDGHDESKLRFVDTAVFARHVSHNEVANLSGDGSAKDAADEGADVDETGLDGAEIVGVAATVDGGYRFGEDDQPADAEGVNGGAPEDARVREENKGAGSNAEPVVVVEASAVGFKGLDEGFRRRQAVEFRVVLR